MPSGTTTITGRTTRVATSPHERPPSGYSRTSGISKDRRRPGRVSIAAHDSPTGRFNLYCSTREASVARSPGRTPGPRKRPLRPKRGGDNTRRRAVDVARAHARPSGGTQDHRLEYSGARLPPRLGKLGQFPPRAEPAPLPGWGGRYTSLRRRHERCQPTVRGTPGGHGGVWTPSSRISGALRKEAHPRLQQLRHSAKIASSFGIRSRTFRHGSVT